MSLSGFIGTNLSLSIIFSRSLKTTVALPSIITLVFSAASLLWCRVILISSDFIYICAQMQISPHAVGVSHTVCVPNTTSDTLKFASRRCPPPDRLSKKLCVYLEPRNLNSKLLCQSLPTLHPPPNSGPPRDYSTESLERKLLGTLSRLDPLKGVTLTPPQPYTPCPKKGV